MRALIADDDCVSRRILQQILSLYGDCRVAVNGVKAIEEFRACCEKGERFDLVCLDIMMPGMDGIDVLKQIRAIEAENGVSAKESVKVIMVTAMSDAETVAKTVQ